MNGNDIFNMIQGLSGGNTNNLMNTIISRFGSMDNALNRLGGILGGKGINPQEMAIKELQGKHFSEDTINQFRQFAKQSGLSDSEIDNALRKAGIIK